MRILQNIFRILLLIIVTAGMFACSSEEDDLVLNAPPKKSLIDPRLRNYFAAFDRGTEWELTNTNDSTNLINLAIEEIYVRFDSSGLTPQNECRFPECKIQEKQVAYSLAIRRGITLNINVFQPFNEEPGVYIADPATEIWHQNIKLTANPNDGNPRGFRYFANKGNGSFSIVPQVLVGNTIYNNVYRINQLAQEGPSEMMWAPNVGLISLRLPDGNTYEISDRTIVKR